MVKNEAEGVEQSYSLTAPRLERSIEIVNALPVRLQTLDLARHIAITPDGKRYVVATYNDVRMGRGYTTAVYPQQNEYLTLYRLVVYEMSKETPDLAMQQHVEMVRSIQQGKLDTNNHNGLSSTAKQS